MKGPNTCCKAPGHNGIHILSWTCDRLFCKETGRAGLHAELGPCLVHGQSLKIAPCRDGEGEAWNKDAAGVAEAE